MKIAVTYDNGEVWQHFGKTEQFKLYTVENGKVAASEVIGTNGQGHGALAGFLAGLHADAVICGGVGSPMVAMLEGAGIKVYPGVTGSADTAVEQLLAGALSVNADAVHEGCHHHHEN